MLLEALAALQIAVSQDVSDLVARTRATRYQQDSALAAYQAVVRQRVSANIGTAKGLIGPIGRPRLGARIETVARVAWDHELGAWGELLAGRAVAPIVGEVEPEVSDDEFALVLPFHPGRDRLWPTTEMRDAFPDVAEFIAHPLADGADSLYHFTLGDAIAFRLPDGTSVELREIRVRPRRPASQLIVGSLWVDVATAALVRAIYRPSHPMDLWPMFGEELDQDSREYVRQLGPFIGTIREIVVEHGLYERRFWLPRTRIASAEGTARGARVSVSIAQSFTYERVAALPPGTTYGYRAPTPDIDPRDGRERRPRWRGVDERTRHCREEGDSSARWDSDSLFRDDRLTIMYAEGIRFRVLLPCRSRDLLDSPELPANVYGDGEELFSATDLAALRRDAETALAISRQAEWEPQAPTLHFGLEGGLLRYNRVEGLSAAIRADRALGSGYTVRGLLRLGSADLTPNAEVTLERGNVRTELAGAVYSRLAASNDWGDVLGMGASARALLFAQDDGFYYRAMGGELTGMRRSSGNGPLFTWRLFAERHDSATVGTQESVSRWISGTRFQPNIQATAGVFAGGSAALGFATGLDPRRTRTSGALRMEAAGGDASWGRGMFDVSVTRGLGRLTATVTGAAGSAVGTVPAQRLFQIGGTHTVRGYRAGAASGDAFFLGRMEITRGHPLIRPTVFADIGWAGSRANFDAVGRPLSGAGLGAAFVDGLVRLDVARPLQRGGRLRADLYFEIR
jgi:hypothetical protein